jgi:hypothetical protein
MFFDLFKDYAELQAETLSSSCFINNGKGGFTIKELPAECQLAPVFSFSTFPLTGKQGFLAAGNFYGVIPYEGEYDALQPTVFSFEKGTGQIRTEGNIPLLDGEVRDLWLQNKMEVQGYWSNNDKLFYKTIGQKWYDRRFIFTMMLYNRLKNTILFSVLIVVCSCNSEDKSYNNVFNDPLLYAKTVKELNNVVMQNNFPPIIASRNYAYANIAAYETIAIWDKRYASLTGYIKHLPALPRLDTTRVNFHYASLLAYCKVGEAVTFPSGSMKTYTAMLDSLVKVSGMPDAVKLASNHLADSVANHILRWSKKDNYAETRTATKYTITNEEGRWVPTPPAYQQALEPNWNKIRPLVMDSASQFMPPRPPSFNMNDKTSKFYQEVLAVKNAGDSLTDEQKHIICSGRPGQQDDRKGHSKNFPTVTG